MDIVNGNGRRVALTPAGQSYWYTNELGCGSHSIGTTGAKIKNIPKIDIARGIRRSFCTTTKLPEPSVVRFIKWAISFGFPAW
jgi:hypothetical protein